MAKSVEQLNQLVVAKARNLHISPRKMRLVTNLVNNMKVSDALVQLEFANKKAAPMVIKLLQSAIANAVNNFSLNSEQLFIKTITTDMGPVLKRTRPRARGSAFIIRRKMSHVNVILEERGVKTKAKKAVVTPKPVKKSEPVVTQEGSVGKAVDAEVKATKGPAKVKAIPSQDHLDQKGNPGIITKRGQRTTNK